MLYVNVTDLVLNLKYKIMVPFNLLLHMWPLSSEGEDNRSAATTTTTTTRKYMNAGQQWGKNKELKAITFNTITVTFREYCHYYQTEQPARWMWQSFFFPHKT